MKKSTLFALSISIALLATAFTTSAQDSTQKKHAFAKGDKSIGLSMGLLISNAHPFGKNFPALTLVYDHALIDNVGPGTISVGAMVGYQQSTANYLEQAKLYRENIHSYVAALRVAYHLYTKNPNLDVYAGIMTGIRSRTYSGNSQFHPDWTVRSPFTTPLAGAKYQLTKRLNIYGEFGYDLSFGKIGFGFKL